MAERLLPELRAVNAALSGANAADFGPDPVKTRTLFEAGLDAAPRPPPPSTVRVSEVSIPAKDGATLRSLVIKPVASGTARQCALVWYTWGGGIFGKPEYDLPLLCTLVEKLGIVCVAPAYRHAPEHRHPTQVDDALDAFTWTCSAAGATALGLSKPLQVAIGGSSFGGFLAARVAQITIDGPVRPIAVILDCPVLAPPTEATRVTAQDVAERHVWTYENGLQSQKIVGLASIDYPSAADDVLLARLPPHFFGLAEVDSLTADALIYAQRLICRGVSTGVYLQRKAFHCFAAMSPELPVSQAYFNHYVRFLEECIGSAFDGKVVILTGSNRGVGLALAELIASSRTEPTLLLCTSRAGEPSPSILAAASSTCEVAFAKLDISRADSIASIVDLIKERYGGKVDVLICNGGINADFGAGYKYEVAKKSCDINYRGNLNMARAVIPFMSKGSRIVTLTSAACQQPVFSPDLLKRVDDPKLSLDQLEQLIVDYENSVRSPKKDDGWPHNVFLPTYSMSKLAINLFTRILGRDHPDLLVNCCCPGACDTEMGNMVPGGTPPKTASAPNSLLRTLFALTASADDGARIPFKLGFGEIDGVSGAYWANPIMSSKESGQVIRDWLGRGIDKY